MFIKHKEEFVIKSSLVLVLCDKHKYANHLPIRVWLMPTLLTYLTFDAELLLADRVKHIAKWVWMFFIFRSLVVSNRE